MMTSTCFPIAHSVAGVPLSHAADRILVWAGAACIVTLYRNSPPPCIVTLVWAGAACAVRGSICEAHHAA